MNVRRGLFRLWILFSSLFVLGVGVIWFEDVKKEFAAASIQKLWDDSSLILLVLSYH
jgi:hypothetical protein